MSWILRFFALFLLPLSVSGADQGTLTLFRWNEGYRAEREAVLEQNVSESDFRQMVDSGKLPEHQKIFRGCYLAHFRKSAGRTPASEGTPKAEIYRICVPSSLQQES